MKLFNKIRSILILLKQPYQVIDRTEKVCLNRLCILSEQDTGTVKGNQPNEVLLNYLR